MFQAVDIQKHKNLQQIKDISDHNLRQSFSNNINRNKTKLNTYLVGNSTQDTVKILEQKLLKVPKFRKDAVKVVNFVFSASPEFFKDKKKGEEWEKQTQKFIEDTFGKENILYSVVHRDEKTPHFHVSIVPIDPKGKLNASHWFDGPAKLKKFHTDYNNRIKHLGLKRGQEKLSKNERPSQESLNDYYKKVNASVEFEESLDKKLEQVFQVIENPPLKHKLNPFGFINDIIKPTLLQLAKNLSHYRTKAKQQPDLEKKVQELEKKVSSLELKFENLGLSPNITFLECNKLKDRFFALAKEDYFSQTLAPATSPQQQEKQQQKTSLKTDLKPRPKI